jgi:hypothetical protein
MANPMQKIKLAGGYYARVKRAGEGAVATLYAADGYELARFSDTSEALAIAAARDAADSLAAEDNATRGE